MHILPPRNPGTKALQSLRNQRAFILKEWGRKLVHLLGFLLSSHSSITQLLHKLLQLVLCQQNVIINTAPESASRSEILMGRHSKRRIKPKTFGESEEGKGEGGGQNCHMNPVWTNGAYTRTEVSHQDQPVPSFWLDRCKCISSC